MFQIANCVISCVDVWLAGAWGYAEFCCVFDLFCELEGSVSLPHEHLQV